MEESQNLLWDVAFAAIVLIVVSIMIVTYSNPVSEIIDKASQLQAKYLSYQITGIISLSQSSESGISTRFDLPRTSGKIYISKIYVDVDLGSGNNYRYYFTEYAPLKTKIRLIDYMTDPANPVERPVINVAIEKIKTLIIEKDGEDILIKSVLRN